MGEGRQRGGGGGGEAAVGCGVMVGRVAGRLRRTASSILRCSRLSSTSSLALSRGPACLCSLALRPACRGATPGSGSGCGPGSGPGSGLGVCE